MSDVKVINFKVDAELYKKMKLKVVMEDTTIKGYIIKLISQDLKKDENK